MLTSTNNAVRQADFDQGKAVGLFDSLPAGSGRGFAADMLFAQRSPSDPKVGIVTDSTFTGFTVAERVWRHV